MEQQSMISTKIKFVDKEQVSKKKKVKLISKVEPFLYLTPAFAVFMVFVFYPFVKTIILSLSQTNLRGEIKSFVGLENFIELFQSPEFYSSIIVTFKFVFLVATPSVIIGFVLALLANNKLKGNRIYELMFSLPMAIASAPAAAIWTMIFHPTNGVLNFVLGQEIGWLTDPRYALISVAVVTTWLNLGLNFIFLTTGLRNIPTELLESSAIDGANFFHKLKNIIIPMVSPQMFLVIFMNLINAFQAFGQIKLLTQGGPGDSTNVLVHSIYREAFFNGRFETACTQALVLFVIMMIVTLLQFKFEKKGVHYQ
ncbi:sugar ABC transporter permease [Turicibacter bilis]|uniref:Sugar ABC transporter permease n=1 Tax=Turicibacter bilis TaxID=2735723 RepID=A0A9Q9CRF0_9FIRM|nr:sugar ABC transporter permease [Turicibacter bilis]MBS3198257.1 sugar ABC transporter permease [Turicibacter bilis]MBS3200564.1 sugar ABC transporter permease [Turicibacter bilis]UUF05227.1 sugar ABC transporter permease [Turicibacter bilis]UUF09317.1 sugar ABC transporter permease [Turicibacter bilis]